MATSAPTPIRMPLLLPPSLVPPPAPAPESELGGPAYAPGPAPYGPGGPPSAFGPSGPAPADHAARRTPRSGSRTGSAHRWRENSSRPAPRNRRARRRARRRASPRPRDCRRDHRFRHGRRSRRVRHCHRKRRRLRDCRRNRSAGRLCPLAFPVDGQISVDRVTPAAFDDVMHQWTEKVPGPKRIPRRFPKTPVRQRFTSMQPMPSTSPAPNTDSANLRVTPLIFVENSTPWSGPCH